MEIKCINRVCHLYNVKTANLQKIVLIVLGMNVAIEIQSILNLRDNEFTKNIVF